MDTGYYLDERSAVLGNTLIRLNDPGEQVRVENEYGGHRVTVLGGGALVLPRATQVTVAEGFVRLEADCFAGNRLLREIYLPTTLQEIGGGLNNWNAIDEPIHFFLDRRMRTGEWTNILQQTIQIGTGACILQPESLKRQEFEPAKDLPFSLTVRTAAVRREMETLFLVLRKDGEPMRQQFFSRLNCLDLRRGRKKISEMDTVTEMIQEGRMGWHDPAAEKQSDRLIRLGRTTETETDREICLILCGEIDKESGRETAAEGTGKLNGSATEEKQITVRLHIFRQRVFYPALRPVRYGGEDWWIYSRHYLTGEAECPYIRMEMGVMNREGLVTDRQKVEEIYAKYRLLTLL